MSAAGYSGAGAARAVVVVGMSAGGLSALHVIVCGLPERMSGAMVVAQHLKGTGVLPTLINGWTNGIHRAAFARDGALIEAGQIYVCPGEHHVAINADATLHVSSEAHVEHVRPSIDRLFESAAATFGERCIAVILSGSNEDGARGALRVARAKGVVIVQDPNDSQFPTMPSATIKAVPGHVVCRASTIASVISDALAKAQTSMT